MEMCPTILSSRNLSEKQTKIFMRVQLQLTTGRGRQKVASG